MINSTIAALTLAAATAVKLKQPTQTADSFMVSNVSTSWSNGGEKATVTFDAPSTKMSTVSSYTVNFKSDTYFGRIDKELTC